MEAVKKPSMACCTWGVHVELCTLWGREGWGSFSTAKGDLPATVGKKVSNLD